MCAPMNTTCCRQHTEKHIVRISIKEYSALFLNVTQENIGSCFTVGRKFYREHVVCVYCVCVCFQLSSTSVEWQARGWEVLKDVLKDVLTEPSGKPHKCLPPTH